MAQYGSPARRRETRHRPGRALLRPVLLIGAPLRHHRWRWRPAQPQSRWARTATLVIFLTVAATAAIVLGPLIGAGMLLGGLASLPKRRRNRR